MSDVGRWCLGVCYAAIFCAVALLISSQKRAAVLKLLCSLMIAAAFIVPLLSIENLFSFDGLNLGAPSYNSTYNGYTEGLEYLITAKLHDAGFTPEQVTVYADGDEVKVAVYLPVSQKSGALIAQSTVYENFSLKAEIVFTR